MFKKYVNDILLKFKKYSYTRAVLGLIVAISVIKYITILYFLVLLFTLIVFYKYFIKVLSVIKMLYRKYFSESKLTAKPMLK